MAVMANQACMVFDFFFFSSSGILRQPEHLARERETFVYLFCPCTPYGSRFRRKERKKERRGFSIFSKFFFSASIKLSGN